MWWWLLLGYVPDELLSVLSHVMRWWLLLGYMPDELLSVLPM